MWTILLTFTIGYKAITVTTVGNYNSVKACEEVATAIVVPKSLYGDVYKTVQCVQVKDK